MKKHVLFPLMTASPFRGIVGVLLIGAVAVGVSGCKAWRTISTTATYVQQSDSAQTKTTTTISTKTVEEYQGVRKR